MHGRDGGQAFAPDREQRGRACGGGLVEPLLQHHRRSAALAQVGDQQAVRLLRQHRRHAQAGGARVRCSRRASIAIAASPPGLGTGVSTSSRSGAGDRRQQVVAQLAVARAGLLEPHPLAAEAGGWRRAFCLLRQHGAQELRVVARAAAAARPRSSGAGAEAMLLRICTRVERLAPSHWIHTGRGSGAGSSARSRAASRCETRCAARRAARAARRAAPA